MKIKTLEDLLTDQLKDLYSAENMLVKTLPKMAKNSQTRDLRSAFEEHLTQTENHVRRIEQACSDLGVSPRGKKCVGMEGLIEEGKEILSNGADPDALDAGLIGAAQKVEHYEIAAYGTAAAHARQLGFNSVAQLLDKTLEEEKIADEKLTKIAENRVNVKAAMEH
ncbi:MAG TPA: ferritin-like domain-containing protein [Anaerolineales bacterium]|nr:ferritin-like domain-containing protein [Anaerolineales bacterium]